MTPRQQSILTAIAQIYVKLGNGRHALSLLYPILRTGDDHAAMCLAIQAHIDLQHYDTAIDLCQRLAMRHVADHGLRMLHAQALYRAGHHDEARACLENTGAAAESKGAVI